MEKEQTRPKTKEICGEQYFYIWSAAEYLNISVRSLSRLMNKKFIRYLNYLGGKFILPAWCDEWMMRRVVQPRKTER